MNDGSAGYTEIRRARSPLRCWPFPWQCCSPLLERASPISRCRSLAEAFAAPFHEVQAVVVAYLAALTVAVFIAGRLGDSRGLKPMLLSGLGLFAVTSFFCAVAPQSPATGRGTGNARHRRSLPDDASMALMRQTASEARIGHAMGLLGTVSAIGTALGPALGGFLIPLAGWRGVFWVQVPLAILAMVLVMASLPTTARRAIGPRPAFGLQWTECCSHRSSPTCWWPP